MSTTVTTSQIELENGEVEKIITDDRGNRTYLVEVTGGNDLRVSHNKRYAADGTTLSAGQTHTVSNLRGEQLFAAAFEGPTAIRVREASADVQSQPQREVSVIDGNVTISDSLDVSNRSAREIGKARLMDSDGVLIDPATESSLTSVLPRQIDTWSAGTLPVDIQEPETTGVESFTHSLSGSLETVDSSAVPAGVEVVFQADPDNSGDIQIGSTGNPSIVLEPRSTITFDVMNTDQIGVNGNAGDELNVTHEVS